MEIGDWRATQGLNGLYRDIRKLDLEPAVAELDAFGFTVVPDALPIELVDRCRDAILRTGVERFGTRLELESESTHVGWKGLFYLLAADRAFEEVVLNERVLALVTYMLGPGCLLSSIVSHVKGPGGDEIHLHADNTVPAPFASYAHVANVNYALTDYTRAAGALAMVPGSHRLARQPNAAESRLDGDAGNPDAIPIEIPAGSAVVWHGNTWHGSYVRQIPGLRINLATFFVRPHMALQEDYRRHVPDIVARYGAGSRLARLMGADNLAGWLEDGPDMKKLAAAGAGRAA
ncbi:MAG: phytanoyl-CoA dioxygenase family protein [Sphingopyxis sp.]|nr:phytanoyl-CoA dioxygenase family protein [Sphingopyxis sp.]